MYPVHLNGKTVKGHINQLTKGVGEDTVDRNCSTKTSIISGRGPNVLEEKDEKQEKDTTPRADYEGPETSNASIIPCDLPCPVRARRASEKANFEEQILWYIKVDKTGGGGK